MMNVPNIPTDLHNKEDVDHSVVLLSKSDIAKIALDHKTMIAWVERALKDLAQGDSLNPTKIEMVSPKHHSMNYAMMGTCAEPATVGMKLSHKFFGGAGRQMQRYYTALLIFDDNSGQPLALADCSWITAARTPAVSALIVRETMREGARKVLIVGSGMQAQYAAPMIAALCPQLDKFEIFGHYQQGLQSAQHYFSECHPEKELNIVEDLEKAAREADVIVGVSGGHSSSNVQASWLKPGAVSILVGYGIDPAAFHEADYKIATSEEQMKVTGQDFAYEDGSFPELDGNLPDILMGKLPARRSQEQRVFAYNSGLVVTDIAVGRALYEAAKQQNLGQKVALW
ncbi:hypothetical protein [Marinomonas sp.]|uniref:hypothetical protein n=1 Tax=Marinomonas sp. TaxID=1904862 RepID=UPI003BADA4EF